MLVFILTYCTVYASHLDKFVKINNEILRILLNQSVCTSVPQMYEMFGLLPIEKMVFVSCTFLQVFKCIHCSHLVLSVYIDRFVINSEVHNYNTRLSQNLHFI